MKKLVAKGLSVLAPVPVSTDSVSAIPRVDRCVRRHRVVGLGTLALGAITLGFAVVAAACGSDPKRPPLQPTATAPTESTSEVTSGDHKPEQMAVNVDEQILKACNIKFGDVDAAPKFDFDSEALTQPEKDVLESIAKCLTTGPLKGRSVALVGRADPRGEQEYNMSLGARRARSVHGFLAQLGVPDGKMRETSRGELDATGTDESGWRRDRRVDVKLLP